jgi:hypothetical protein
VDPKGIVSLYAGCPQPGLENGARLEAKFFRPTGITLDRNGNLLLCDTNNNVIRFINTSTDQVETYAGAGHGFVDGPRDVARFHFPHSITASSSGDFYVSDSANQAIRCISGIDGTVSTLTCGYNTPNKNIVPKMWFDLFGPEGISSTASGDLVVSDGASYGRIHLISTSNGEIKPLLLKASGSVAKTKPKMAEPQQTGNRKQQAKKTTPDGPTDFCVPSGICVSPHGDIFVSETGINSILRNIASDSRVMETFAGEGPRGSLNAPRATATFNFPQGLAICPSSGDLFVCDHDNHKIRRICAAMPPQHKAPLSLPGILKPDSNAPTDFTFCHVPTGYLIALHSQFLCMAAPKMLGQAKETVENLSVSVEALDTFFYLLHGAVRPLEEPLKAEVFKIADACGSRSVIEANLRVSLVEGQWCNGISPLLASLFASLSKMSRNQDPKLRPNFKIECDGQTFWCHDWVMAGRWPYFQRSLAFGGAEFHLRTLSLPSDCLSARSMQCLLEFIYTNNAPDFTLLEQKGRVIVDDLVSIMENAPLLGFVSMDTDSLLPGLAPFMLACISALTTLLDPADPTQTRSKELLNKFWWDSKWSSTSLWK